MGPPPPSRPPGPITLWAGDGIVAVGERIVRDSIAVPTLYEMQGALWLVTEERLRAAGNAWVLSDGLERLAVTGGLTMTSTADGKLVNARIAGRSEALGEVVISVRAGE